MLLDCTFNFNAFYDAITIITLTYKSEPHSFEFHRGGLWIENNDTIVFRLSAEDMIQYSCAGDIGFDMDLHLLQHDITSRKRQIESSGGSVQTIRLFLEKDSAALEFELK